MHRLPPADPADVEALRSAGWIDGDEVIAVTLLEALRTGPDPEGAVRRIADLARRDPSLVMAANDDPILGLRLVALAGGSRALMSAVTRAPQPGSVLGAAPGTVGDIGALGLAVAVRCALATIAAADLAGEIDMPESGRLVAEVADQAARASLQAVAGPDPPLAVMAMGKWGGRELNYASDIDLVLVHRGNDSEAAATASALLEALSKRDGNGGAFRVDAGLRPEGASGPLTRSLESYQAYWERWAETWELQALLKARFVAGDAALGEAFLTTAAEFVFPEKLGADAVRSIRAMKQRTEGLLDADVTELKRGVGGIRDVEFAVQLLQLVHGRADSSIRSGNTLEALGQLAAGGYVIEDDATVLGEAYRWLRDTEHRIQLFDLRQTHTLPEDLEPRRRIARSLGYRDDSTTTALEGFEADLARRRNEVRSIHERLFHRPVLDALAESRAGAMTAEAAAARLSAFGFLDTEATRAAVAELTAGLSRRSRLMRHMLPLVMEWLSLTPDPDLGLSQLRRLIDEASDTGALIATLRDDPFGAERLCMALGTSRLVARLLDRLPPLIPLFGDDASLSSWPGVEALRVEAVGRTRVHEDPTTALHVFHAERLLAVAVADLAGLIDEAEVGHRLSDLADATVHAALAAAAGEEEDGLPGIAALGKWGGRELNYSSDLDAIVIVADAADVERASVLMERVIAMLGSGRAGFRALELDLNLRPEGRKGALVRSIDGYEAYWSQWAQTWELQAMMRARPAAGDLETAARLAARAREHVHAPRPGLVADIRAMKARVETERIPSGDDPDFHLKLGRGGLSDVEWTIQLLQMQHGGQHPDVRHPSTLRGLAALEAADLLDSDDASVLTEAYRFCARVRNRLFLREGRTRDSLPAEPDQVTRLARALGYTVHPRTSLREDYRRITRRARRVMERLFYGIDKPGSHRRA